ncbi:MAG: cell wall hydrolase [Novosphingobium sp.]|nr:cell wall hydrolase [Novosphingobium sp.]
MRSKLQLASGIALAATLLTALVGAAGSGAAAQEAELATVSADPIVRFTSEPVIQYLPPVAEDAATATLVQADEASPNAAASLAELAAAQPQPSELSREMHCLAGAIYFEARGEPLKGQLAVGRVIMERAESGRFPGSYCDVVFQRSQFSFVRGGRMPKIRKNSTEWHNAQAIAQIADSGSWDSPVEGALFFHAARVSPGWRLKRLARVGNHIFYR